MTCDFIHNSINNIKNMDLFVSHYIYDEFSSIKITRPSRMRQRLLPWIVKHIERNLVWCNLSLNPNAITLLETNQHKIQWFNLSHNSNAIELLEANQDKIYWQSLSRNQGAIQLLEANQDKIDWCILS